MKTPMYPKPDNATRHVRGGHVMAGDVVFLDGGDPDGYPVVSTWPCHRHTINVRFDHPVEHSTILNIHEHVWIA